MPIIINSLINISVTGLGLTRCSSTSPNRLSSTAHALSSYVTEEIGCGSLRAPWLIEAQAGQTVQLSLLDFNALDRAKKHSLVTCTDVYGFVVEKSLNINQTICGQNTRESVIYRSKTNAIEVYVRRTHGMNFFITYTSEYVSLPVTH